MTKLFLFFENIDSMLNISQIEAKHQAGGCDKNMKKVELKSRGRFWGWRHFEGNDRFSTISVK